MRIRGIALLSVGLAVIVPQVSFGTDVELKSKATELTLTGRVHTQFNTTSVEGELGSEFLIRRARITVGVKLNDIVSGKIQPDYGEGKLSLKDAYSKIKLGKQISVYAGQFKRPFDAFELMSSTQILVVERAGEIRGASGFTSLSSLTESLHYSDRDIGVKVALRTSDEAYGLDAAVTNGDGANKVPSKLTGDDQAVGEKQYTARVFASPPMDRRLVFAAGITTLPIKQPNGEVVSAVAADPEVEYATAFEVSAELGDFEEGIHLQAEAVFGDNWKIRRADSPSFTAIQGIAAYKYLISGNPTVSAIEPVVRMSWADPNTDADADAGLLFTPGLQVFFVGRTKFAVNVDIFSPQSETRDTEYSIKAQTFLYF